jgi:hypothetical protein
MKLFVPTSKTATPKGDDVVAPTSRAGYGSAINVAPTSRAASRNATLCAGFPGTAFLPKRLLQNRPPECTASTHRRRFRCLRFCPLNKVFWQPPSRPELRTTTIRAVGPSVILSTCYCPEPTSELQLLCMKRANTDLPKVTPQHAFYRPTSAVCFFQMTFYEKTLLLHRLHIPFPAPSFRVENRG